QLPDGQAIRSSFLKDRRIGRLSKDFVNDLHYRVFRTVAMLGFDDYGWLPDADLEWILQQGRADLKAAESKVHEKEDAVSNKAFDGIDIPAKEVEAAKRVAEEINQKLAPYETEKLKRQSNKQG